MMMNNNDDNNDDMIYYLIYAFKDLIRQRIFLKKLN
jgi:hypothetical protein